MKYLIQGFLVGFAYVAPIGTQNLFVINTALTQPRKRVIITALIIMFFDVTLSLACFFGAGAIMSNSIWLQLIIILIGSLVVIYIGISLVMAHDTMEHNTKVDIPIKKVIATACVVTWFNPQAIIDGTMLFGASKATIPAEFGTFFIIGSILASITWWGGMPMIINLFRTKITDKTLRIINVICGSIIIIYGFKLLYSGVQIAINYFG